METVRALARRLSFAGLIAGCVLVCFVSIVVAQRRRANRTVTSAKTPRIDYSKFSHTTHAVTQNIECKTCHKFPTKNWKDVRKGADSFPDVAEFPEHSACLNCHRQQFFARE